MIIEEQKKDMIVVGEDTSKKATISSDKMAKLQYLLTKGLYKDPITAVIAEWTNNGIDSVVEAGKNPTETPVIVQITKNDKGQYVFSVEDKGIGLDKDDFENICMNYLESTKEGNNDTIGHFGIGMKSFLSLERSATFICRKEGVERMYVVYEGTEFVNYDLIYERPTDEESGVKAELVITGWSERTQFIDKAKQKLSYYDTAALLIDGVPVDNVIHRNDIFQWSTQNNNSYIHLCLKDVYYSIDWEALGIPIIPVSVALRFDLSSGITPTPSRESYITNEKTKNLILGKIKEVANFFVERYNETVKEFDTFHEAYDYLGNSRYDVTLSDNKFNINPLTHLSNHKIVTPKVKGITLQDPYKYKELKSYFFYNYVPVAYYTSTFQFKTKVGRLGKNLVSHVIYREGSVVIVGDNFVGNVKEFLKDKYGRSTMFVKKNWNTRKLGNRKEYNYESYRQFLNLTLKSKDQWRNLIKEWQFVEEQMTAKFHNEVNVDASPEFVKWLEDRRLERIERRKLGYTSGNYKALNKQDGEVTMAYSYKSLRGISFKKNTYKISTLPKSKHLTVVLKDEELENAKKIIPIMNNDKVLWALVGNKEVKKLPITQFINFEQFMSRDCKPFMRLASALVFDRVLDEYNEIKKYRSGLFQKCLASYVEAAEKLTKYVAENLKDTGDGEVKEYILKVAEDKDLFDKQLWDVYIYLKNGVAKYDWITCIAEPRYWDDESTKKYNRVIAQLLLFRKKYYNDLPENIEIVFKDETPVTESGEEGEPDDDIDELEPEKGDLEEEFDEEGEALVGDFAEEELLTI